MGLFWSSNDKIQALALVLNFAQILNELCFLSSITGMVGLRPRFKSFRMRVCPIVACASTAVYGASSMSIDQMSLRMSMCKYGSIQSL